LPFERILKSKEMNIELLNKMIAEKYVKVQKHPTEELYIYNYTAKAQYEQVWNDCTLQCRGLILNANYEVVARPFPKFFNLGEQENQHIPNEPFEVYEKMDGSLGILYWLGDEAQMASRGSFASEQSQRATQMLHRHYAHALPRLDKNLTYLFEIIYPQNRIVVDYGKREELVLLGIIDTRTGEELPLKDVGFPMVKRYEGLHDLNELKAQEEDNKEGFVVRFQSGYRLKIKFEEYVRIHRIVTQVSSVNIWEYLKTGQPLNEILERVPDEFYQWVKTTKAQLIADYQAIEKQAKADFKTFDTRKETAMYFKTCKYPQVLFAMLDRKSYDQIIWKMLRPTYETPFKSVDVLEC